NGRRATADPYRIRPASLGDVAAVRAIEQEVFADPWSAQDFTDCVTSDALFLVAEAEGSKAIGGYVVALDAADEGEILTLAGPPAGRRSGEHTSELHHEWISYAVFCLKKKKKKNKKNKINKKKRPEKTTKSTQSEKQQNIEDAIKKKQIYIRNKTPEYADTMQ